MRSPLQPCDGSKRLQAFCLAGPQLESPQVGKKFVLLKIAHIVACHGCFVSMSITVFENKQSRGLLCVVLFCGASGLIAKQIVYVIGGLLKHVQRYPVGMCFPRTNRLGAQLIMSSC